MLFVGQLEPGKRPELFLDAIASLRNRGLAFDAAIVGDGSLRDGISARAASLSVDLLGRRKDIPTLLRDASVLVMTSAKMTEGMPGVLIEAGLSGVPVVSTAAAGVSDVVADGETGVVIHTDSPEDIADAVAQLITHAGLRQNMGTAARARCVTRFSIEATADLWRGLFAGHVSAAGYSDAPPWVLPRQSPVRANSSLEAAK